MINLIKLNILLLVILFSNNKIIAQIYNPIFGEEYVQTFVPTIEVTMDSADYLIMIDSVYSNTYRHATAVYKSSDGTNISYLDMGIRLRGNTSRTKDKKSIKLHFEKFTEDQKFFGLKKLNLKAETNDPSCVREHLVMNMYREYNVPVARVNHIKLYINNTYMGLYSSVEQIDKTFLMSRFANKTGNLYKCTYGSSNGADLAIVSEVYNNDIYELKTNESANNRTNLNAFISFLNTSSDADFDNNIASYINIESYLRQLALEVLTGHWDGYSYNKNNFYLYYNTTKAWFEYIPYDTDNTLGIDWVSRDWSNRNIYDWAQHGNTARPLYTRVLGINRYAKKYSQNIDTLLNSIFTVNYQMNIANGFRNLISPAVSIDTFYTLDNGYDTLAFLSSYTSNNVANHAPYGIQPFITKRKLTAEQQLNLAHLSVGNSQTNDYVNIFPNPINDEILTISLTTNKYNRLLIIDMTGSVVMSEYVLQGANRINIRRLSKGIYYVQLQGAKNTKSNSWKIIRL